jgi:hypothetical protein
MKCSRLGQFVFATVAALALAAIPLAAVGSGQKKTGGGTHSMTGCLQKGEGAKTFKLTNVEGTGPKEVEIVGMAKGVDLSPHVGHKVTITGTAVDAKVAAKAEGTKDVKKEAAEHHMQVSAVKMISATCP